MLASPSSRKFTSRTTPSDIGDAQSNDTRRRRYLQSGACAGFFLLIAAGLSSCGAPRPVRYYQLEPPALAPTTSTEAPYPVTILLGPMTASSLYREDRIVYGTESEGMGLYEYQRWAEPPTEMIHEILLRELRGSRRFSEVYPLRSVIHGDYLLRGRLYDFKEVSVSSGVVARVNFELELRDNKTLKTVWGYSYRQDEPVSGKDAAAVVAALDKNIARGTQEAVASIEQYFAQNPPQPAGAK
jgi:ABC-type uncharacterized transport system auxiliary subunit